MKRKYIILIIFISILLLCVSIGFASWGINGRKSQKVEEDVKSYVVIDLDNISDSEPVFLYNSQGLYSDDGLGYDTSFTVQLNVVEEVAPYNLTISLIDKDNVLLGATITSEIKSSTEEETEAIISGDSSIFIEEINYTTTYYLKFYIHTTESNYSDIYSKLSSEHEELGLKITANTEDGSWSIDKTIILSATFQNLITVEKPTAIQNLEYMDTF